MSSRALRKLQRLEEEKHRSQGAPSEDEGSQSDEPVQKPQRSTFNILLEDAGDDSEEEQSSDEDTTNKPTVQHSILHPDNQSLSNQTLSSTLKKPAKRKKKKNKKKGKPAIAADQHKATSEDNEPDEIDKALAALRLNPITTSSEASSSTRAPKIEDHRSLYRLLEIDLKHLNSVNEMKRLFGRAVADGEEDEEIVGPRRRERGTQTLDLGTALSAKYSPVSRGQGLKSPQLRRNPLMVGKTEWPMATSGGLSMEVVEKMDDGTTEYRFVHSTLYQNTQAQFMQCVESMDPQRMISLLQFNPYHISTLLQVSEIAKQQGDHSVSGDLLERALFSFGRSAQSSFVTAMSEGRARLDFRRPENREFWLAASKYVTNLGQRGTWRTSYEWTKLILSLDPEGDPYCISSTLDQLALRSGQQGHLLKLVQEPFFRDFTWLGLPNMAISTGLAQNRLKLGQQSRATLRGAINDYPWVFARLAQELNLPEIPQSVWGKTARNDWEAFTSEQYVLNAKDLWGTPEAVALLAEVLETASVANPPPPSTERHIHLDDARVCFLSGNTALINLIPRHFTSQNSPLYDPFPPEDSLESYSIQIDARDWRANREAGDAELAAAYADLDAEEAQSDVELEREGAAPASAGRSDWAILQNLPSGGYLARMLMQAVGRRDPQEDVSEATSNPADSPTPHLHATVESDTDDDDERYSNTAQITEPLLRSAQHPDPSPPTSPLPGASETTVTTTSESPSLESTTSPSRNPQSYLAGQALQTIRAYAEAQTSTDAKQWWAESPDAEKLLQTYAATLATVPSATTRNFLLRWAIPQALDPVDGRGKDVSALIQAML